MYSVIIAKKLTSLMWMTPLLGTTALPEAETELELLLSVKDR
jgi:hypothetical protein